MKLENIFIHFYLKIIPQKERREKRKVGDKKDPPDGGQKNKFL